MSKKQTYKGSSESDLDRIILQSRDELQTLRFSVAGSKNQNVKKVSSLRKIIARALTQKNIQK